MEAYIARAVVAQERTNCLTESKFTCSLLFMPRSLTPYSAFILCSASVLPILPLFGNLTRIVVLFEEARNEARALDAYIRDTGEIKGMLHGVPVSFKDICETSP
jgi:hypothetical protein